MYKYEIIANEIRKKINNNEFKINEKLPDEKTLSKMFNCSRMTMKQAMDTLVSEGYIIKSRGIGTFVRAQQNFDDEDKRFSNTPNTFGFSKNFEGYDKKTVVRIFNVIPANDKISQKLQLKNSEFVYQIKRVRYLDKRPIIFEEIYMPIDKIVGLNKNVVENSLYSYIENEIKIKIYNADKIIRAITASNEDVDYLGVKEGDPILEMEHVVYSRNNIPIEYAIVHYRGDSYELHFVTKKE